MAADGNAAAATPLIAFLGAAIRVADPAASVDAYALALLEEGITTVEGMEGLDENELVRAGACVAHPVVNV